MIRDFECKDERPCFGKRDYLGRDTGKCHVLNYQDKYPCNFCKDNPRVTKGVMYNK